MRPLDPELEELLQAERGASPPAGARERVRSRVMLSVGLAAAGSVAAGVGKASGAHGALLKAAPKLLSLPAKLVMCVAGVTAVGLGVHVARKATQPATRVQHARNSATEKSSAPVPPAPLEAAPPVAPAIAPVAPSSAITTANAIDPAPAAAEPSRSRALAHKGEPVDELPAERALLEQGRAALGHGDAARALAAVERHQRKFPRGQLAEERESLWIRALVAAGEPDAARERAADFRARYPRSIFLPVVEATVKPLP
ncbi:MAG TPA: hypothetical protein VFF06_35645 [Polyangia bacterium]|nr:hypothetical protein [Polyangia bacterium]